MLQRKSAPFRAEHIGSLLRPPALNDNKARFQRGEINAAALREAEDLAIKDALALQERLGFRMATDGEFRRRSYHSYFYSRLGDINIDLLAAGAADAPGHRGAQPTAAINSRVTWSGPINVPDFEFVRANTPLLPKVTIPGPCALHFRGGDKAVLARAYADLDQFWDDIVAAFDSELKALSDAGCRYVQIDETAFAKFGDPDVQASLKTRGDDWDALIDKYISVTNRILAKLPATMQVGMHLCRGNRGGQWHAEGSYDAVAERLFNDLMIQFYFLEYDSERAGSFTPLRLVPPHKRVVLGLISTKTSTLEDIGELKRRIDEATHFIDIDRLSVSPQCGFASVETGNPITAQDQERKLRLVVELAREVWKDA